MQFRETQIWFDYKQREIFSETFFRIIYFENINPFSAGVLWKITNKNPQENKFKRLYIENKVLQNNIFFARSTHVDTQEGALPPTTLKLNVTLDSWGIISEFINGNMNYYKWQSQIMKNIYLCKFLHCWWKITWIQSGRMGQHTKNRDSWNVRCN